MTILELNPQHDFERQEKYILSLNPSVLKFEKWTPKEIYAEGIEHLLYTSRHRSTFYINGQRYCGSYELRSITDLFKLSKFYYPEKSLIELYEVLCVGLYKRKYLSWICGNIHKRVYSFRGGAMAYLDFSSGITSERIDEYRVIFPDDLPTYRGTYGEHYTINQLNLEHF